MPEKSNSKNFDWYSDEDHHWPAEPPPLLPPRRRLPGWSYALVGLLILAALGWLLWQQANRRVQEATALVEADVRAAHSLLLTADTRDDRELLRAMLSGRDPTWVEAQESLADTDLLLERQPFGLYWQATAAEMVSATGQITVSSDFNSAEFQYPLVYTQTTASGDTVTVTLQQTAVYRRGDSRWLFAPPEATFWGDWFTSRGGRLTLIYPERDDDWASRLAVDLDALIGETCQVLADLQCPDDLHLTLRLSREPGSLARLANPLTRLEAEQARTSWLGANPMTPLEEGLTLELPTLSLVGRPVDEASYQALYRGYGAWVAGAVVMQQVGWTCCQKATFFQALLDYQLSQLQLKPWPVTMAMQERVALEQPPFSRLDDIWGYNNVRVFSTVNRWLVYTAVDFLLHTSPSDLLVNQGESNATSPSTQLASPTAISTSPTSPATWQRTLPGAASLSSWMVHGLAQTPEMLLAVNTNLDVDWWLYAYEQTRAVAEEPPMPLPTDPLFLACTNMNENNSEIVTQVYEFDLQSSEMDLLREVNSTGLVFLLPDKQTAVFNDIVGETWQLSLWRDGTAVPILADTGDAASSLSLSLGQTDSAAQRLLVYTADTNGAYFQFSLLSLAHCQSDDCPLTPLSGLPYWSPDSQHAVLAEAPTFPEVLPHIMAFNDKAMMFTMITQDATLPTTSLWLTDGDGQPITGATDPFTTSGYAPFWLDNETFGFVRPSPTEQEIILGQLTQPEQATTLVRTSDIAAQIPELALLSHPVTIIYAWPYPHDPNQLVVVLFDLIGNQDAYIVRYDRQTHQSRLLLQANASNLHSLSFSPDGRWLLVTGTDQHNNISQARSMLFLHDLNNGTTQPIYLSEDGFFAGIFPYSWSPDGQWLAISPGNHRVMLLAPAYHYTQLVTMLPGDCMGIFWLHR